MRDELYADTLDVVKWTAVVRAARAHAIRRVVHLAMKTTGSPLTRHEGKKRHCPHGQDAAVDAFFRSERTAFDSGAPRTLDRIVALGGRLTPPLTIDAFDLPFTDAGRDTYFRTEFPTWFASRVNEPAVVFVDPDTSVKTRTRNPAYVTVAELVSVLAVKPAPVVLCYAHRGRSETVDKFKNRVRDLAATGGLDAKTEHYSHDVLVVEVSGRNSSVATAATSAAGAD